MKLKCSWPRNLGNYKVWPDHQLSVLLRHSLSRILCQIRSSQKKDEFWFSFFTFSLFTYEKAYPLGVPKVRQSDFQKRLISLELTIAPCDLLIRAHFWGLKIQVKRIWKLQKTIGFTHCGHHKKKHDFEGVLEFLEKL